MQPSEASLRKKGRRKGKGRGLKSQPRRSRAERKGCNAMANKSGTEGSATPPDQSATPPTPAELTSASDLAKGSPSPPEHARRHRSYTPSKAAMRLPSGPSQPSSVKEAVVLANQARPGRSNRVGTEVHLSGFPEQPPTPSPFQRAMLELADSLLPVRGHALLALAKLLRERDTETVAHATTLLAIFKENLGHSDSYIYLAAVDGLSALAVAVPGAASLLALCRDYAGLAGRPSREQSRDYDSETGRIRRRGDASVTDAPGRWLSSEERVKVGEALVRVVRGSGEVLPCHADEVLAAILFNVRDPDAVIRASALSNLADVCPSLGYSFGLVQHEVCEPLPLLHFLLPSSSLLLLLLLPLLLPLPLPSPSPSPSPLLLLLLFYSSYYMSPCLRKGGILRKMYIRVISDYKYRGQLRQLSR